MSILHYDLKETTLHHIQMKNDEMNALLLVLFDLIVENIQEYDIFSLKYVSSSDMI